MNIQEDHEMKIKRIQKLNLDRRNQEAQLMEMNRIIRRAERTSFCREYNKDKDEDIVLNLQKRKISQARKIAELEQEQKLAQEMADLKDQETVKIKTKQLFENNCHKFRDSQRQLRVVNTHKELIRQIKEKEAMKKEEKVRAYYNDLKMLGDSNGDENCHEYRSPRREMEIVARKNDLMCQVNEKQARRKEEKLRTYYEDLKIIEDENNELKMELESQTQKNQARLEYKKALEEQIREDKHFKDVIRY